MKKNVEETLQRFYRNKKRLQLFIIGLVSLLVLVAIVTLTQPNGILTILFHVLFFTSVFCIVSSITQQHRQGLLIGGGITLYLLLRYIHLRETFYLALLVALVISLELYLKKH